MTKPVLLAVAAHLCCIAVAGLHYFQCLAPGDIMFLAIHAFGFALVSTSACIWARANRDHPA